jgi:hypothetical protein
VESGRLQGFPVQGAFASAETAADRQLERFSTCDLREPLREQSLLELYRRPIVESRVQPLFVVHLFEKPNDRAARLAQIPVFVAQYFFVLEAFYK